MSNYLTCKMRKVLLIGISFFFVVLFSCSVYAKQQSVPISIRGSKGSTTFTIYTRSNWKKWGSESITLKQNKVTATFTGLINSKKTKTKKYYPRYKVTVKTGKKTKIYTFKKAKLKIKLSRNKKYTITVSTNMIDDLFGPSAPKGYVFRSETESEWWVASMNKVSLYADLDLKM